METSIAQKHRGILFDKRRNKWRVVIKLKGKTKYLGDYCSFDDAVKIRLGAENLYQKPILEERENFEKTICNLYLDGKSQHEIGNLFNKDQSTIHAILKNHNIPIRNKFLNLDETEIIELYKKDSIEKISKKFNISHNTVKTRLVKNNIEIRPNRKYFFDESIFEKVDCEWKAYYLGFFYADAGLTKLNIKFSLHEKDKEIVYKLNDLIFNNECNVKYSPEKIYISKKTGKTYKNSAQNYITLNSKKLVTDLCNLGCGLKKSLTLKFPTESQVSEKYMSHFIRGYFDGDGCIQKQSFQIISSDDFCNALQRYLYNKLKIKSYLRKCDKVSRIFVHKHNDITQLKKYIYDDATIYLNRKHTKFLELGY